MLWVLLCAVLAVVGIGALIAYGLWLYGQAKDVAAEVAMVRKRGQELSSVLGQLQLGSQKPD